MNIFYLDKDIDKAAEYHNDKHCVKMIVETAQLLSTAHRILDGTEYYSKTANGRKIKRWKHPNSNLENTLYKASHVNHPSAKWVRESKGNYNYLYKLFNALSNEYTYRYGKTHLTYQKLHDVLAAVPQNIPDKEFTQPPPAMPDDVKNSDSLIAYRDYYKKYKSHIAVWTKRDTPSWYNWSNA